MKHFFKVISLVSMLLSISACGMGERHNVRQEAKQARVLWESQEIRDYNMTIETLCPDWLAFPTDLVIRDGKLVDAYVPGTTQRMTYYHEGNGPEVSDRDVQECYKTVEQLFELLEQITSERPYPHDVYSEFDETYGYPSLISTDHSRWVEDDEYLYEVTRFEVISP